LIEIDTAEAGDLNRLLVAQVLEQEANLSGDGSLLTSARDHLLAIANRAPTAQTLSVYIEFLLRQGAGEATNSRSNSSGQDSNPITAEQKEAFLAEADARLTELKQLRSGAGIETEVISVAYEARLLKARGHEEEAKQRIDDLVAKLTEQSLDENVKAQRYLAIGKLYTSVGAHAEAENWYRQLIDLLPNGYVAVVQSLLAQEKRKEAVQLCLDISNGKPTAEMATLLANVMTAADKSVDDIPEAQAAIETAIKNNSENIELLHAEAVRRASLGQYDEAIAIFRRVLDIDPENVLALNNFATVLAERPNQRGEALEHIERAIELAGRKAALLDTHGTILLKIGDAKQAIISLEEATAGGEADARYYLHLAAAYQLAQRHEDALRMLGEARGFGLDRFVLTGDDRELLAKLDEKLSSLPSTGTP
jgi:tetratricopeptide (TPR) repeat protein